MLYQLSVLRVMHRLLVDRSLRTKARMPAFQGLLKLATKVRWALGGESTIQGKVIRG